MYIIMIKKKLIILIRFIFFNKIQPIIQTIAITGVTQRRITPFIGGETITYPKITVNITKNKIAKIFCRVIILFLPTQLTFVHYFKHI